MFNLNTDFNYLINNIVLIINMVYMMVHIINIDNSSNAINIKSYNHNNSIIETC